MTTIWFIGLCVIAVAVGTPLSIVYLLYRGWPPRIWKSRFYRHRSYLEARIHKLQNPDRSDPTGSWEREHLARHLQTVSIQSLNNYPGIGPTTIERLQMRGYGNLPALQRGGFESIPGIGPKRGGEIRAAVDILTRHAQSQFAAGKCPQSIEFQQRKAAWEAQRIQRDTERLRNLTAVREALEHTNKFESTAKRISVWAYMTEVREALRRTKELKNTAKLISIWSYLYRKNDDGRPYRLPTEFPKPDDGTSPATTKQPNRSSTNPPSPTPFQSNSQAADPLPTRVQYLPQSVTFNARQVSGQNLDSQNSLRWIGTGQSINVSGFDLRAPLVYVTDSRMAHHCSEPAAIDLAPVRTQPIYAVHNLELPYWRYDQLSDDQRRFYFLWLSMQRHELPRELGFVFLFIYNLERRALVDQKDQELIIDEVLRLRQMYASTPVFRGAFNLITGSFIWFLLTLHPTLARSNRFVTLIEPQHIFTDEQRASMVYSYASRSRPLPAWVALRIAESLAQSQRSVITKRLPDQFQELFSKRYQQRFGQGMEIRLSKRNRTITYQPANASLRPVEIKIPDALGAMKQYEPLAEIWNECIPDLRKLGAVVQKEGTQTLTAAQWEAMPTEIRAGVDHPLTVPFCQLVERHIQEDGHSVIPASELSQLCGLPDPQNPTRVQSQRLCETAGWIGYGVEPDARLTNKTYRNGQPLGIFLLMTDEQLDAQRYQAASAMMHFGIMVAAADGTIHEAELAAITQHIEMAFAMQEDEKRRLEILRQVLARQGPDRATLTRIARELTQSQREAVGKLLLALIVADGVVEDAELKIVATCYKILGLDPQTVRTSLIAMGAVANDDEPITVRRGEISATGEAIPAAPTQGSLKLDHAAIDAIMRDTREVAQLLAQAMTVDTQEESVSYSTEMINHETSAEIIDVSIASVTVPPVSPAATEQTISTTNDVPPRYAAFFAALIAQDSWPVKDAEQLAREHRLMLAGAIEALNEWSLEKYNGQLFYEDNDRLMIERSLMN